MMPNKLISDVVTHHHFDHSGGFSLRGGSTDHHAERTEVLRRADFQEPASLNPDRFRAAADYETMKDSAC
jgi:glyoxylase-like metal-dependent hydrolase (beta-lactamase superfamily II)